MAATTSDTERTVLYRARHGRDEFLSESIVEALAAVESVEPHEFTPRLYDRLDPEALDRLYDVAAERSGGLRLAFTVAGYEVVVGEDGRLLVRADGESDGVRR